MRALKRWFDRSLTAQAVVIFLVAVGVIALLSDRDEHPASWLIQGAIYTAIVMVFLAVQRRRTGRAVGTDPRGLAELNRRIRHREVPKDPEEQAAMRRLVAEQLGRMERGGRWLPYWLGFMGLVAAGMIALGVVNGSLAFPLVFAVGVIGFCCWVLWMRRHWMDRCRFMRSALQSRHERVS
ncbi:hypothetical protein ACIBBD_31065 [Streptomyces sp. NPDC051315]|uniref:hypothetical protein n=1 Tax=Streptomyces sp. NPDC051315 TaxID=3365650 RepID=UPI0037B3373A